MYAKNSVAPREKNWGVSKVTYLFFLRLIIVFFTCLCFLFLVYLPFFIFFFLFPNLFFLLSFFLLFFIFLSFPSHSLLFLRSVGSFSVTFRQSSKNVDRFSGTVSLHVYFLENLKVSLDIDVFVLWACF